MDGREKDWSPEHAEKHSQSQTSCRATAEATLALNKIAKLIHALLVSLQCFLHSERLMQTLAVFVSRVD